MNMLDSYLLLYAVQDFEERYVILQLQNKFISLYADGIRKCHRLHGINRGH